MDNKNINLLGGNEHPDIVKKSLFVPRQEYTAPKEENKEKDKTEKRSLYSRLFGKKEKQEKAPSPLPLSPDNIFLRKTDLRPEKINGKKSLSTPPAASLDTDKESAKPTYLQGASGLRGLGVNLLSEEYAASLTDVNRKGFFIWAVVITFLLVILMYLIISLYGLRERRSAATEQKKIEELEAGINSFSRLAKEDEMLIAKSAAAQNLLDEHISWPKFLSALEVATIPEVTYLNISASRGGQVNLVAIAIDYTAVGRQLNLLEKDAPWVKKARIASASLSSITGSLTKNVSFDLSLEVDPEIFLP